MARPGLVIRVVVMVVERMPEMVIVILGTQAPPGQRPAQEVVWLEALQIKMVEMATIWAMAAIPARVVVAEAAARLNLDALAEVAVHRRVQRVPAAVAAEVMLVQL